MKNWYAKLFFSIVIALYGFGGTYTHLNPYTDFHFSKTVTAKTPDENGHNLNKGRSIESFKRKMCLFDNEENEENFSAVQKQFFKSNYFLIFHCSNPYTVSTTAFTQKVNDCKIFSLLYNKVYLLFQVFRI